MSAPAARSRSIVSRSSRFTAQCRAVVPSASALLTSTFCLTRARTADVFPLLTLSSREGPAGAAAALTAASPKAATHRATRVTSLIRNSRRSLRTLRLNVALGLQIRKRVQREPARAVAKRVGRHSHFVEHAQQQVGHRNFVRIDDVTTTFEATSQDRQWKVVVRVQVRVAQSGAV